MRFLDPPNKKKEENLPIKKGESNHTPNPVGSPRMWSDEDIPRVCERIIELASLDLTKEQIISHVWDYDADILPNTVEVFIGYLRSKIDRPFENHPPLINTVRGFGYRIGGKD